jgi:hypothetical protein
MNAKRAALLAAFKDPPEGWERIPHAYSAALRWRREMPTPDWAREDRGHALGKLWDQDSYTQLVFLNLTSAGAMPIMRVCRAPWVRCSDTDISLQRALAVLADPAAEVLP